MKAAHFKKYNMATVFVKHGDEFQFANPSSTVGIKSNDVVLMGDVVGVALTDILPLSTGTVQVSGVATLAKKTGEAWTIGAKLYWDNTAKNFTTTDTSNTWAGWAYAPALSADAVGNVKLKIS